MNVKDETTPVKERASRRFSWAQVDPELARAMLVHIYDAGERREDAEKIAVSGDEQVRRQAAITFGRPPRKDRFSEVAAVVTQEWLPITADDVLFGLLYTVQLGLSGPDRTFEPRTRRQALEFFMRRRLTDTFVHNLRSAFVAAHKLEVKLPGRNSDPPQQGARWGGATELVGQGSRDTRTPYPHQSLAWSSLDRMFDATKGDQRSGLLVLPTGAGKTYTMVAWLVRRLSKQPGLRVLWIADQQELLDQAGRAFSEQSATMPVGTSRSMRVIHSAASRATALGDMALDIACITRQSLIGGRLDAGARTRLKAFLSRPCVVVIDEAHHAVAPSYQELLRLINKESPDCLMVGLTATPWPTGYGMAAVLRAQFPTSLAEVQVREMVLAGVLARPVMHTVETGESVVLSKAEVKQIAGRDVPASVLRKLDRTGRNDLIVNTWLGHREQWGKTLVFACDIEHADNLGALFESEGVNVTVLHSQTDVIREDVLRAFRTAKHDAVLISVGMLLEGVDVPDARTAFLTRPTTSRVLMRQMIGRVLRGPSGGGEAIAHVVDLRDRWGADVDVLAPVDIPGVPSIRAEDEQDDQGERRLPPVIDLLTEEPLGEDILRRIEIAYTQLSEQMPHPAAMFSTELVGFYNLDDINIPVFAHARSRWEGCIACELGQSPWEVHSASELFEDLALPRPPKQDVDAVSTFCRSRQVAPPLVAVRTRFSVRETATELLDAGAMTEMEKVQRLRGVYESTLARSAYRSFQAFYEAVQQEVLSLTGVTGNLADPESPGIGRGKNLPKLIKRSERDLGQNFSSTVRTARELLVEEGGDYLELLQQENLPRVDWTRQPVKSTWAYWTTRMLGSRRGTPEIRVNRALQAARTQISDQLLEYLLWHELCHHLLPGRGHDAEFRRLESLWPGFAVLDHELDTLHERFDLGWDEAAPENQVG